MKNAERLFSLKKMGIIGIAIAIIFGGIIIPRIIEGQNNTTLEVAIVSWRL